MPDAPITAIVLAAGSSRRMGQPKINLPWGASTVLGTVLDTLLTAGVNQIITVTGPSEVMELDQFNEKPVRFVYNPRYHEDSMLLSLQTGLQAVLSVEGDDDPSPGQGSQNDEAAAALVVLGDMPAIQEAVIRAIRSCFQSDRAALIVPSFRLHRGHPWLVARELWNVLLSLPASAVLSDFLNDHADKIYYLPVDNDSILRDIDTPQDYARLRPGK